MCVLFRNWYYFSFKIIALHYPFPIHSFLRLARAHFSFFQIKTKTQQRLSVVESAAAMTRHLLLYSRPNIVFISYVCFNALMLYSRMIITKILDLKNAPPRTRSLSFVRRTKCKTRVIYSNNSKQKRQHFTLN